MTDSNHAHWADPETGYTAEDMLDDMNGYEEIAVASTFGVDWSDLAQSKPGMFTRCLVYTALVRDAGGVTVASGEAKAKAKETVMLMPMKACQEFWQPEPEDNPDPVAGGEPGKDAA